MGFFEDLQVGDAARGLGKRREFLYALSLEVYHCQYRNAGVYEELLSLVGTN